MDPSARKAQGLSVRVVVRVRPITSTDASHACTCLSVDPDRQHVSLSPPEAGRAGHKYSFDAALTDAATQEEVYEAAGVQQLVQAAAQGAPGVCRGTGKNSTKSPGNPSNNFFVGIGWLQGRVLCSCAGHCRQRGALQPR